MIGKTVPRKTVKVIIKKNILLKIKKFSFENNDTISSLDEINFLFFWYIKIANTTVKIIKTIKYGPILDWAKECTDDIKPLLVIKVPKIDRKKARNMRHIFHLLNKLRVSWAIEECRNAVNASQGIKATVSPGAQAQ